MQQTQFNLSIFHCSAHVTVIKCVCVCVCVCGGGGGGGGVDILSVCFWSGHLTAEA